jgi:uroporphyrinogen-III synthase
VNAGRGPAAERPLDGVTVVVTRAVEQATPLVEALEVQGARVVALPLLHIVDDTDGVAALRSALGAAGPRFDGVVVTSPNGARCLAAARPAGGATLPPVYVVGPGTAAAWEAAGGIAPAGIANEHLAEGVVARLGEGSGRLLVAQGDLARPVLVEGLRAAGWDVTAVVVYRTVTRQPSLHEVTAARRADVVTLASSSAAQAWRQACGTHPSPPVVVMGPVTADTARSLGLPVVGEAQPHTLEGLVEATVRAVTSSRRSADGSCS